MKQQAHALLIYAKSRGVLNHQHMAAGDLGAGSRRGRGHHLVSCYVGIVQKPRNPHLSGTIAAKLSDAHTSAAVGDKPLKQEDPPFSSRSSPNCPSISSIAASPNRITAIGGQFLAATARLPRCVNVVALWERFSYLRGRTTSASPPVVSNPSCRRPKIFSFTVPVAVSFSATCAEYVVKSP